MLRAGRAEDDEQTSVVRTVVGEAVMQAARDVRDGAAGTREALALDHELDLARDHAEGFVHAAVHVVVDRAGAERQLIELKGAIRRPP